VPKEEKQDMRTLTRAILFGAALAIAVSPASFAANDDAQAASQTTTSIAASSTTSTGAVAPPPDYVIGPDDQLSIIFWRDKDLSADVVVRPDGKISLPLLNDVQAGGLTPEQLRQTVTAQAKKYIEDPTANVIVKQINSRKVFITGEVEKPGTYTLSGPMTVLQLIATAGGLKEYAKKDKIVVLRNEGGNQVRLNFNYKDVVSQKNPSQNIDLRPGDTVVVP
jgi:polysaccharide biosynthesis/export protein